MIGSETALWNEPEPVHIHPVRRVFHAHLLRYRKLGGRTKMKSNKQRLETVGKILDHVPEDWLKLTTHRLDVYDESQAKTQFLERLVDLEASGELTTDTLGALPTAYDYIRLGHPLSCVLEWVLGTLNHVPASQVITFTSRTMPILAMLRSESLAGRTTHLYFVGDSAPIIDLPRLERVYGYRVELRRVVDASEVASHDDGAVVFVTASPFDRPLDTGPNIDITVNVHAEYGSALLIHSSNRAALEIAGQVQHVRRRESIAMTPPNALLLLHEIMGREKPSSETSGEAGLETVVRCIQDNTGSTNQPLIASSGLSIQYAILMGLVEYAMIQHAGKPICLLIPPNCYGGTNDQARRVAALVPSVTIVDMLVDGGQDMTASMEAALETVAERDGVPLVLAEIPTNPRVEVPDMTELAVVLTKNRQTPEGATAAQAVFMVDQTFCPNVKLLGQGNELAPVKTVSFSSGSKFPSGGLCVAGYCAFNDAAKDLLPFISAHLTLSDNVAVAHQIETLAICMPSIPVRVTQAYQNARDFVAHIRRVLPKAKINFVSDALAQQGFTPSVFSLDLPAQVEAQPVEDYAERLEARKRLQNIQLIEHMVSRNPEACKHCVSYGQLKGSYWTIPATSTQGTTKESDKDYIVRVALSPDVDVDKLSRSFTEFCQETLTAP